MYSFMPFSLYCDTRNPNIMRVAPTPLYNTFTDVLKFVKQLKEILVLQPLPVFNNAYIPHISCIDFYTKDNFYVALCSC